MVEYEDQQTDFGIDTDDSSAPQHSIGMQAHTIVSIPE
jgi:hypothetical protein